MTEINHDVREQVRNNLKESGYEVTQETVDTAIDNLIKGNKPTNIIGMMAESMLKKAGLLV